MAVIDRTERQFELRVAPIIISSNIDALVRLVASERIQLITSQSARRLHDIIMSDKKEKILKKRENEINVIGRQIDNYFDLMSISVLISEHTAAPKNKMLVICDECSSEMVIDPERSEAICSNSKCSAFKEVSIATFPGQSGQENQKAKTGKFLPDRHLRSWLIHIQAKEDDTEIGTQDKDNLYGEKLIADVRATLAADGEVLRLIDPYKIRTILKRLGKSKYNRNTSKIMKKLTGIGPPSLSDEMNTKVCGIFSRIVEIHERIHDAEKPNRNFYPYYIFKILELIIAENDKETMRILFYIYLQSSRTLSKNDSNWLQIITELNKEDKTCNYRFISTSRYQMNKFGAK
jgi:hypothetical protein